MGVGRGSGGQMGRLMEWGEDGLEINKLSLKP